MGLSRDWKDSRGQLFELGISKNRARSCREASFLLLLVGYLPNFMRFTYSRPVRTDHRAFEQL